MKKLVVIEAGLSTPSSTLMLAEAIAGAVESQVSRRGEGLEVEYIHAKEFSHELATMMTTGVLTPRLAEIHERISTSDAVIAATPVFSASYSGLFKMFFDAMGTDSLNHMPVVIAATAGTARHSLVLDFAMRPLFTFMRAKVMPTGVFAATDDLGGLNGQPEPSEGTRSLETRIQRAANELAHELVSVSASVEGFVGGTDELFQTSGKKTQPSTGSAELNQPSSGSAESNQPSSGSVEPDQAAPRAGSSHGRGQGSDQREGVAPRRDSGAKVAAPSVDFAQLLRGHDGG